ncbi:MAG: hypothetical protein RLZZ231_979, partial [Bacteroidota bacterium]
PSREKSKEIKYRSAYKSKIVQLVNEVICQLANVTRVNSQ